MEDQLSEEEWKKKYNSRNMSRWRLLAELVEAVLYRSTARDIYCGAVPLQ